MILTQLWQNICENCKNKECLDAKFITHAVSVYLSALRNQVSTHNDFDLKITVEFDNCKNFVKEDKCGDF